MDQIEMQEKVNGQASEQQYADCDDAQGDDCSTLECEDPSGYPDWGPPGNRRCYECGEPVDDKTRSCKGIYDDPLASVLGVCDICDAPRYEVLADCPVCGGPVYMFKEAMACYHTIAGTCDFSLNLERMEELGLIPLDYCIDCLTCGDYQEVRIKSEGMMVTSLFKLYRNGHGGWDVRVYTLTDM